MKVFRLLAVALVTSVLAGCTIIPTSGAVKPGPTEAPDDPSLVYLPPPPVNGADRQAIVAGFVYAASAGGDYTVAKRYLTSAARKTWRPNARILVHDQSWSTTQEPGDRVDLSVPATGRIEADGTYTPITQREHLPFHLVRVAGQWRIDSPPQGIVLLRTFFPRLFVPETLAFFDPTFTRLVPDLRWFPAARVDQTGPIVRALLAQPAAPLRNGVVVSAFPKGTRLTAMSQPVGGPPSIALDVPGPKLSETAAKRVQQQLTASLPPGTSPPRLSLNGFAVPPLTAGATATATALDPRAFVLAGGRFGALSPDRTVAEDATLGRRIAAARPTAITVSPRQRIAVLRTTSGAVEVTASTTRVVDRRPGLTAPTLDQGGWVWTVPTRDPAGLAASPQKGAAVLLGDDLGGAAVSAIEVSPDGTRLLVLVQTDTGSLAYVAGIERAADGTPIGLSQDRFPVALGTDRAVAATWVDDGSVAVLVTGGDTQHVLVQPLGGVASTLGELANAASIVGGTDTQNLRTLIQGSGDVNVFRNNGWQSAYGSPVQVSVLAVQR